MGLVIQFPASLPRALTQSLQLAPNKAEGLVSLKKRKNKKRKDFGVSQQVRTQLATSKMPLTQTADDIALRHSDGNLVSWVAGYLWKSRLTAGCTMMAVVFWALGMHLVPLGLIRTMLN